jgi:hypothetical protein
MSIYRSKEFIGRKDFIWKRRGLPEARITFVSKERKTRKEFISKN